MGGHEQIFNALLQIVSDFIASLNDFEFVSGLTLLDVIIVASVVTLLLFNFVKGGH